MPYLISYLAAGIIFGIGLLLNGRVKKGGRLVAFVFAVVLWPLIALFATDVFFSPRSDEFSELEQSDALQKSLSERKRGQVGVTPVFRTVDLGHIP